MLFYSALWHVAKEWSIDKCGANLMMNNWETISAIWMIDQDQ